MVRALSLAPLWVLLLSLPASAQALEGPADLVESAHRLDVVLDDGLAAVAERIELARSGAGRAEVALDVPLPRGARVVSIRICRGRHCRRLTDPGSSAALEAYAFSVYLPARGGARAPVGSATLASDAVHLRVAPVEAAQPLAIELRYVVSLEIHEGIARVTLPASGVDARLSPLDVSLTSHDLDGLSAGELGAHATLGPASPIAIEGHVRSTVAHLRTRASVRARAFVVAPRTAAPHDVILAIDVSPSMEDVPSGRLETAVGAVLAALPAGSRVRALRFGARAQWVSADGALPAWGDPSGLSARALVDVAPGTLGSRTLYAPVAARVDEALVDTPVPLLIVVGDGVLPSTELALLAAAGGRTVVVNVSDLPFSAGVPPSTLTLAAGSVLAGRGGVPLSAAVAEPSTFAVREGASWTPVLVPSGEPYVLEGSMPLAISLAGRSIPAEAASWSVMPEVLATASLAVDPRIWGDVAKFDEGGPPPRRVPGGVAVDEAITGAAYLPPSADGSSGIVAHHVAVPRIIASPPPIIVALPSSRALRHSVVRGLRARVRGCFAMARRGRPAWSARAVVELVLAHREVVHGAVSGTNVDASLAACIAAGFDDLQIPPSHGVVQIDYPFRSDPVPPVTPEPLAPDVRASLDAWLGPPEPLPTAPDALQRGTP